MQQNQTPAFRTESVLTGLTWYKLGVSVRPGWKVNPHLLWHVHALDAVPVDVVVERGVLGAVLSPLPLRRATQHLLAFPLPCTTTRPQKPLSAQGHPKNASKASDSKHENKATQQLQLCACFCKPVFAEVKSGLNLIDRPFSVVTSKLKWPSWSIWHSAFTNKYDSG